MNLGPDLSDRLNGAVRHFWGTRNDQSSGTDDDSGRGAVVGGAHMDGFVELVRDLLIENGVPREWIRLRSGELHLPGFFRATKQWDLLVVNDGVLIAAVEYKSQVGSFGNNYNNRTEEAIGNAVDLWTAFRESAFQAQPRPWLGYLMLLEDAKGSRRPIAVKEPHFQVFEVFRGASYAERYQELCRRLLLERLYDGTCFLLSDRETGPHGSFVTPDRELGFETFMRGLISHAVSQVGA